MKKPIIVLGLGNPLMSDEGVGCAIIERLAAEADRYPLADFTDAGTGGMAILHLIEGRQKAVIIDCAKMNCTPGTLKKFGLTDIKSVKTLTHQSLHEADILKIIDLAIQLNQCPPMVVIFGIEPESIELGQNLSPAIAKKLNDYIAAITQEITL